MPTHDPESRRPPEPPPEQSFWALLPKRNIRYALFLIAALVAILVIKRTSGFSLAKLFNDVAPPPAPPSKAQQPPFQHLEVKPR